jgi:two-component system chemotaxis sensor kinase CheA
MRAEQQLDQLRDLRQQVARWQKSWRKARPYFNRSRQAHMADGDQERCLVAAPLLEFLEQNEQNLKDLAAGLNSLVSRLSNDKNHLHLLSDDLQDGIRRVRLQPIAILFDRFPRLLRDLAREEGKEIVLLVEGAGVEVDRQVLELMVAPLTHLLRNALDHGIELPAARQAAGKPPAGTIRLRAEQRGNDILLQVGDDGAGMDPQAVRRAAVERGLLSAQDAAALSDAEALKLILRSGFSTASQVTALSGRGVGLDVVHQNLEQLHGLIQIDTQPGLGTTFTLTLPLTLTTTHLLLVQVSAVTVALPMTNVERILRVQVDQIFTVEGRPVIYAGGQALPLISLGQVLELSPAVQSLPAGARLPVVILRVVDRRVALSVDALVGAQEAVVKNLGRQLRRVRNVAGATILGDGQVVVILNVAGLMKSIQSFPVGRAALPTAAEAVRRRRVLVVDDSITTRTLEKHILENAGYQVQVAADGQEAWDLLHLGDNKTLDLVVADVQMPHMDGFELTEKIKGDARTDSLPVILVTSLESPQDRLRGLNAGADAYITKGAFDQRNLLETIERLIG